MSAPKFEYPPGLQEMARRLSEQFEPLRAFTTATSAALEQWRLRLPSQQDWFARYGPLLADFGRRFRESWEDAMPPNWEGFDDTDDVSSVIARVESTGYCLVWVPRVEILREVLAGGESETSAILLRRSAEVLADVSAVLADIGEPEFALERDAAEAAVRALREGHAQAAQALAASVLASTIHGQFVDGFAEARRRMAETHPEEAVLRELRLRTIYLAGAHALTKFDPVTAQPVRPNFNRHGTAHRITPEQWTEENALSGVMLVAGFLRELNHLAVRRREERRDAA